jgi:hypothetical protein
MKSGQLLRDNIQNFQMLFVVRIMQHTLCVREARYNMCGKEPHRPRSTP